MTDAPLVVKKLAFIETCLRQLREHAQPAMLHDIRELRFVEHTLQIAIQAALDATSHIVSDERFGEPQTNRSLFELLSQHGWLTSEQAAALSRMAGFRNILVHGYAEVDLAIVKDVLTNHLGDLDGFVAAVRAKLT